MYVSKQCFSNIQSIITINDVISQKHKEKFLKIFQSLKPINSNRSKNDLKYAAVLAPLCIVENELSLLFTVRAEHLKINRGEVAFPGGMQDKADLNLQDTALRETFEEIGIPAKRIEVWGGGPAIGRDNLIVTPFVGYLGTINTDALNLNSNEVRSVFTLSLNHLIKEENFRVTHFRDNERGGYKLPVYLGGPVKIWGLTAVITHIILSTLVPAHYQQSLRIKHIISV